MAPDDEEADTRKPMDYEVIQKEARELGEEDKATPEQLAALVPAWAAEMMLDPVANEEYESSQARGRAAALHARRVEGRSWEELDNTGYDGEGAGMAEFTPEELSEDYNVPLESVIDVMLSLGVERQRLNWRLPVKECCTAQQQNELLNFFGGADPIAMRESLCESTLVEIADGSPFSAAELLRLCVRNEISVVLGEQTRIKVDDYATLQDAIQQEAAFRDMQA